MQGEVGEHGQKGAKGGKGEHVSAADLYIESQDLPHLEMISVFLSIMSLLFCLLLVCLFFVCW